MSALASLARAYDRLAADGQVPVLGYSQEKIGFLIALNPDGTPAGLPIDLRGGGGRKRTPKVMSVPQPVRRTSGVAPNFLWDKTAYVLGVTSGGGKRTAEEHAAFVARHRADLAGTDDEGLLALLRFLDAWTPERFVTLGWPEDMKDENIVFALESERLRLSLHDRPAARDAWVRLAAGGGRPEVACLLTGRRGAVARLHPAIKGVWGAQTAGAAIVSFNAPAFTSYGKVQGDNAPVSEAAAFAYSTALNRFLEHDSGHRIQIGDASTVFWAEAENEGDAALAEAEFGVMHGIDQAVQAPTIGEFLAKIRSGRPIAEVRPDLPEGVRFHVLALSPNAARLAIRFYVEDDFGVIVERYLRHLERLRVEPPPKEANPSIWRVFVETGVLRKSENVAPKLAGDWMRAILTDTPYPATLLSTVLMRFRADHEVNALRVGILKSVLIRNFAMEVPVALDPESRDPGYLLGRLFAVYEQIQTAALGQGVNATIKDKFYGAAAAQPRKVFPLLANGSANHLAKVRKDNRGRAINLDKAVAAIMEAMAPGEEPFPASLPDKSQALFSLGYYHQRNDFYRKADKAPEDQPQ